MTRIRRLYYFDKSKTEEMISVLNNSANDTYINHIMFNPFIILHHLLPLKWKFLPESYVLKDNNDIKGLITVAPTRCKLKKMEIQKLFFEENSLVDASELVQFVASKYKAMGAVSIIVKVDDYLPELLVMFVTQCGFSQISSEKLWRINHFVESASENLGFRLFRNSDSKSLSELYNESLLPHFRPLLSKEPEEFEERLLKGLSYYSEYKYVLEDKSSNKIIACITILTSDNENYVIDIIQSAWVDLDINSVLNFASTQIKKRKNRFGLFVKSKQYTNLGGKYDEIFSANSFECVQNQIILTNSSARVLKDTEKSGKYTVLSDFLPAKAIST